MLKQFLPLALIAALSACRRDNVRGLDAHPEVPDSIDFGLLAVNQVKSIPIPIDNTGQVELTVGDVQIDEPFDVETPADAVPPGGSSAVLVKFQPVQPGEVNGSVTLQTSSLQAPLLTVKLHGIAYQPQLTVSPDRLDFGDVDLDAQKSLTFAVTNSSPVPLNVDVEPADETSDFSVSPQGLLGNAPLQPGASGTVTVVYAPSVPGPAQSSVILDCPVCSAKEVLLSGNGIAPAGPPGPPPKCTLTASPPGFDFGKLQAGQTAQQVFTLTSSGTGSCFLQTPYLSPTTDASLSAAPLQGGELAPGATSTFTATYAPTAATPSQVSGAVVVISNDKVNSPLNIALTGELQPPPPPPPAPAHLVVAPQTLTFAPTQVPSAPPAQTLSVIDDGGLGLTWTASSPDDPALALSPTTGSLAAGANSIVTVNVAGQANAGSRTSHLVFDAGAAGQVTVEVNITFTAAPPPPPAPAKLLVDPLALTFQEQAGNTPAPQGVTVSNTGGLGLSWQGSVDDSAVSFAATSGVLAGGASQVVQVSVATSTFTGSRTSHLTINAGAAGQATVVLTITFTQPPPPPPPPQYGDSAWPKWHHDNRSSGLSHVDTSANVGAKKWKTLVAPPVPCITDGRTDNQTRCGTYVNSPVLSSDGSVIQLGGDGNLYEFDRATGKQLWSAATAPPWIAANEGTPTVVKDGSVFLMTAGESSGKSHFYKLSQTGQILWTDTPGGTCNGIKCDGWDSSPALDDDGNLFLAQDDYGAIQTVKQDGTLVAQVPLSPISDIETQSAALADGIGYWSANGHLWALTPSAQLWSFTDSIAATKDDWRPHASFHNIKSSPALTPDGKVIYSYVFENQLNKQTVQTTRVYAFAAGNALQQLWMTTLGPTVPVAGLPPAGITGTPTDAEIADSLHYRSGITSPAVGPDGTIYVGHCDGLYALDPATGKVKWGVGMSEVVSSPAVGKDGTIYVGSMDGQLRAIAPDGSEKWSVKTKGQVNSSPAIGADGTVYVTSDDGYLYAIH